MQQPGSLAPQTKPNTTRSKTCLKLQEGKSQAKRNPRTSRLQMMGNVVIEKVLLKKTIEQTISKNKKREKEDENINVSFKFMKFEKSLVLSVLIPAYLDL